MKPSTSFAKIRPLQRSDIFPIVANILPVLGVAFWGWSPVEAFVVYALETLIVGILTVLKMLVLTFYGVTQESQYESSIKPMAGIFFILFFIVHYGMFAAIQTSLFAAVSRIQPHGAGLLYFFFNWYKFLNSDVAYMLIAFVMSYAANNFVPFIASGEYKNGSLLKLMFQPYGRIFVQQLTVIVGSMFLTFHLGLGFMIVFVAVKLYFDLFLNFEGYIDSAMAEAKLKQEKEGLK